MNTKAIKFQFNSVFHVVFLLNRTYCGFNVAAYHTVNNVCVDADV